MTYDVYFDTKNTGQYSITWDPKKNTWTENGAKGTKIYTRLKISEEIAINLLKKPVDLGVIVAFDTELSILKEILDPLHEKVIDLSDGASSLEFEFQANNRIASVALFLSGRGEFKATMSTISLLKHYDPKIVLNIGVSGGLKDVNIGDVVISEQSTLYASNTKITDNGETNQYQMQFHTLSFSPDKQIFNYLQIKSDDLVKKVGLKPVSVKQEGKKEKNTPRVHFGDTVSGPFVVASDIFAKTIYEKAGGKNTLCVDQESSCVVGTGLRFGKAKLLVIRGISDMCGNKAKIANHDKLQREAMRNAALYLKYYIIDLLDLCSTPSKL